MQRCSPDADGAFRLSSTRQSLNFTSPTSRRTMPAVQPDPIDGRTALMHAAGEDDLCLLFELLLDGADVQTQDGNGWTALTHASALGHYEIAQQLLDSGADPDVHRSYDMKDTPLSMAARRGSFALVRLLIHHGADPNCYAGIGGMRAECYARRAGFEAIAEFLRSHEDDQLRRAH